MNRLLFSRSVLNSNCLVRNYSVKSVIPPLATIVKAPPKIVYKPIVYQISTNGLKLFSRHNSSYAPINIDVSNLTKDVIVFKYENPKHFKLMNIFGIAQFFFWLICSEFTLSNLRNTPIDTDDPNLEAQPFYFRVNLGENKYKYGLAIACFTFGMCFDFHRELKSSEILLFI